LIVGFTTTFDGQISVNSPLATHPTRTADNQDSAMSCLLDAHLEAGPDLGDRTGDDWGSVMMFHWDKNELPIWAGG
jgi:hypothetical protein